MADPLNCYRCGHSLAGLSLPLMRSDECPECRVELHVCRMCMYYDPLVPEACTEDDALEVKEKARANFCDYFKPTGDAYTPGERDAELAARESLGQLFGDSAAETTTDSEDPAASATAALFKK